jgi:hypothetical protein
MSEEEIRKRLEPRGFPPKWQTLTPRGMWRVASYRFGFYRAPTRLQMAVAWHLPHWLVGWCGVRMIAHGTTGAFGHTLGPEVTALEINRRWDDSRGGDRWAKRHRRKHLTPEERERHERLLPERVVRHR